MRTRPHPSWWGRLTLRAKMALVAGIPLAVLAAVVPLTYLVTKAESRLARTTEEVFEVRGMLATVLQDLVDGETGARGYLLTRDPEFLQPYGRGTEAVHGDFAELRVRLERTLPEMQPRIETLSLLIDRRLELLRGLLSFADRPEPGPVPTSLLEQGRLVMEEIRSIVAESDRELEVVLEQRRAELARARGLSLLVAVVLMPLALLSTILVVIAFATNLVRRIRRIEVNAARLEAGEALEEPEPGSDELARLGRTLHRASVRLAAQDAELRDLALIDPLTGLRNRRGFLQIAEHELQVCVRRGSGTLALFIDVDGLKTVNDRFGHSEGDRLLLGVADVLRRSTRDSDLLARVGGDEFCVLLTRDSAVDGATLLERLSSTLAAHNAREGRPYETAFSVGVALFDPANPMSIDELIEAADRSMYEEKRAKSGAGQAERRRTPDAERADRVGP